MTHDTDEEELGPVGKFFAFLIAVALVGSAGWFIVTYDPPGPPEYSHTCSGDCHVVNNVTVDSVTYVFDGAETTVTVVLERPVSGSIVVRGDGGSPVAEATLRSERVVTVELDGDHREPQIDVWVEGDDDG